MMADAALGIAWCKQISEEVWLWQLECRAASVPGLVASIGQGADAARHIMVQRV